MLIHTAEKPPFPAAGSTAPIRVSEVLSALSYALDLTEGQPVGHAVRSCVIGMRIAEQIGLPMDLQSDLFYALLMKDAGCSTNASRMFQLLGTDDIKAKRDIKTTDWTRIGWDSLQYAISHVRTNAPFLERVRALFDVAANQKRTSQEIVQVRCERGASIARRMGLSETTATAIHSLDELWNGAGQPQGLRGEQIPLLSRIMNLAQNVDVFQVAHGPAAAVEIAEKRSARWFDPDLVKAFCSVAKSEEFWSQVEHAAFRVLELEPRKSFLPATDQVFDDICVAFADVIDAKSPFTFRHSTGVTGAAVATARTLGFPEPEITIIRRAALLHDIGKLGVSNTILDKPDKLNSTEWDAVRRHPYFTYQILNRIPGFSGLSDIAASHHEKLDGSGYFRHLPGATMSLPARLLVVADIYDALAARRPYRDAIPTEQVFRMMERDAPHAIDADCLEALKISTNAASTITEDLLRLSANLGTPVEVTATHLQPDKVTAE